MKSESQQKDSNMNEIASTMAQIDLDNNGSDKVTEEASDSLSSSSSEFGLDPQTADGNPGEDIDDTSRTSDFDEADEAFQVVVSNFKALFDYSKVEGSRLDSSEKKDRRLLFESLFDKNLERYVKGAKSGGFDEVFEEAQTWCDVEGFVFQSFFYKRLSICSFDMYSRFATAEDELIIQSKVTFDTTTRKVIKLETRRLQQRKKAEGQISAVEGEFVWPGLTDKAFSRQVHILPREVFGRYFLEESTGVSAPALTKYEMIRLYMYRDLFSKSKKGIQKDKLVMRLCDERKVPYANGMFWKTIKHRKFTRLSKQSLLLWSAEDEPVAMCSRESHPGEYRFVLSSQHCPATTLSRSHKSAPYIQKLVNISGKSTPEMVGFHAWFRLRISKRNPTLRFVYVWDGTNDFEILFRIVIAPPKGKYSVKIRPGENPFKPPKSSKIITVALELYDRDDAANNENCLYAIISKDTETMESEILCAPGVDPGMVLAIAACLNQINLTKLKYGIESEGDSL